MSLIFHARDGQSLKIRRPSDLSLFLGWKKGGSRGFPSIIRCFIILARPAGFLSREFCSRREDFSGINVSAGSFIITEKFIGEALWVKIFKILVSHFQRVKSISTLLISSFPVFRRYRARTFVRKRREKGTLGTWRRLEKKSPRTFRLLIVILRVSHTCVISLWTPKNSRLTQVHRRY